MNHELRLRRVDIESPSLLTEPDPPPPYSVADPVHSVAAPETSDLSKDDLEDLPPSYSMAVLQGAPECFKT